MGIFNIFKKSAGGKQNLPKTPKAPAVYDFSSNPVKDLYAFNGVKERYFTWIFSYYFPQLEIGRKTLPASTNACTFSDEPVVFTLSREGTPVLVVILCHGQEYRRACIRQTADHYQSLGIPVQRYYTNFRNKSTYVVDRIKSVL